MNDTWNSLPSVALVGTQGSGKTTIAARLCAEYGYTRHSWAAGVRHVFSMAYETITIDNYSEVKEKLYETIIESPSGRQKVMRSGGELLQMIGSEALRNQVDSDFWVKAGVRSILGKRSVSDDTRYLNEAEALRGRGWVIVRITAPEDVRKTRIKGAFRPTNHSSETEQKFIAEDYTLDNSGDRTIEDVMTELVSYLRSVDNSFMAKTQRALSDGVI